MKIDRKTWLLVGGSAVLLLVAPVLIATAISITYEAPPGQEQPKVTDWMQAWGGVCGVFAGLAAAAAATALLLHEREQARQARADLAAERAEAAAAAVQDVAVSPVKLTMIDDGQIESAQVTVTNHSGRLIRRVVPVIQLPGGHPEIVFDPFHLIPPSGERHFHKSLRPNISMPELAGLSPPQWIRAKEIIRTSTKVFIYFYDSGGRGWRLDRHGRTEMWERPFPQPASGHR